MVTWVVTALGLAAGLPLAVVAVLPLLAVDPLLALTALTGLVGFEWWRSRPRNDPHERESALFHRMSAELTAGASLRSALGGAASAVDDPALARAASAATAGLPARRVAALLADALPVNGRMAAASWMLASDSGAPAARLMGSLALRTAAEGRLDRETRASTAQARASAWVVGSLPVLLLVGGVLTGRIRLEGDPALAVILGVGLTLQALGVAVVVLMVRRAVR